MESYVAVTKEDNAETLKILEKALAWVKLAMDEPSKFISEVKAEKMNAGWVERLQRKLQAIDERAEGAKQVTEEAQERVASNELWRRVEVKL